MQTIWWDKWNATKNIIKALEIRVKNVEAVQSLMNVMILLFGVLIVVFAVVMKNLYEMYM